MNIIRANENATAYNDFIDEVRRSVVGLMFITTVALVAYAAGMCSATTTRSKGLDKSALLVAMQRNGR